MAPAMIAGRIASLNPARCWGSDTNPELALAAKLAWLLLLCGGFVSRAGLIDPATAQEFSLVPGGLAWMFRLVFVAAGVLLLTNQFTRIAAVLAGGCVVLGPWLSLASWRSHEWICGMILILVALETPGQRPWLLRAQATLCVLAVVADGMGRVDWSTHATLEGWAVDRDAPSLLGILRSALPPGLLQLLAAWGAPIASALLAVGLWIPRLRARAAWCTCAYLTAGYVLVGTEDAAYFTLAALVAMLSFLDWPRNRLAAHWPRACGWPMWLRIALDHYDFDQRTEWPFPQNPDADLEVWVDERHLGSRRAVAALLLYFPLFHVLVFAAALALLFALPQPWAAFAHACMGVWLLAFFALPTFHRLNARWTR